MIDVCAIVTQGYTKNKLALVCVTVCIALILFAIVNLITEAIVSNKEARDYDWKKVYDYKNIAAYVFAVLPIVYVGGCVGLHEYKHKKLVNAQLQAQTKFVAGPPRRPVVGGNALLGGISNVFAANN